MRGDDAAMRQAEKLIGGWVAGTLTDAERSLLLQASMANQALFDALADEEGLRQLLADPKVRRELASLLADRSQQAEISWWQRLFRPGPMAAFSAGLLAVVAFVAVRPEFSKQMQKAVPVMAESPAASEAAAKDVVATPAAPRPSTPVANKAPAAAPVIAEVRKEKDSTPVRESAAETLADKKENAAAPERLAKAAEPAPVVSAAPAAAPPPPAIRVAPADEESKLKRADAQTAAAAPPRPIRYRVERLQEPGGQWVEFGGELGRGTHARLAIDATQAGVLTIRSGAALTNAGIRPGETVYFPATGSLPAESGEREVAILFRPGGAPGNLTGAGSSRAQTLYRAKAAPGPQQQQQQQIPGGGVRQREEQPAQDAATATAGDYSVTVRLRYR